MSTDRAGLDESSWKIVGLVILSIRFVQGWIFWGGGSRRFIYDPTKLDPYSSQWMANKLQSAMPGALLGVEHVISFMLQHFFFLYLAIILFSLAELISGLALILGFCTRLAAFTTTVISIALMIIFGWQGTTCMDEWTMAVSNLAMGLTLILSGSASYSIDSWLLKRKPYLAKKSWFRILASGALSLPTLKKISLGFFVFIILFTLGTYNYYRGAILSHYHAGPVSAYAYHLQLSDGKVTADGTVTFNLYVNAGASAAPTYLVRIELLTAEGKLLENWEQQQLSLLTPQQIINKYSYNIIKPGPYGIIAPVSAAATIILSSGTKVSPGKYQLQVYTIDGHRWDTSVIFAKEAAAPVISAKAGIS